MRVLLNTRRDDAGTRVCIFDLHTRLREAGIDATLNDWNGYASHDCVLFMGYDHEMDRARRDNPDIKVILADPKLTTREYIESARRADLLLVSSIEQRDSFLRLNQNVLIHYMFPNVPAQPRRHQESGRLIVAYHGNRVHLDAMRHTVGPALVALSRCFEVQFDCIYNFQQLGKADLRFLEVSGVEVRHRQWLQDSVVDMLREADIGIMPNELPINDKLSALAVTAMAEGNFAYEPFDHLVRYKVSSNPGRLYPFACAGVPVIADFCPSASQFIRDGESGFISSAPHSWYYSFSRLAASAKLRESCAAGLLANVSAEYGRQVGSFLEACGCDHVELPGELEGSLPVALEQREFNKYPRPQENAFRWLRRQLRRVLGQ